MRKKSVLFIACLAAVAIPAAVRSQAITVEAENFTNSHDIGYQVIQSLGYYIQGLDYPDEWTTYTMSVSSYGLYSVAVVARGDPNETVKLQVILTGVVSSSTQTLDIEFVGTGMT